LKDTFDWISLSERLVSIMHPEFEQSGLEPWCSIDEEFGVVDRMLLA
jgi:hypothetical protein